MVNTKIFGSTPNNSRNSLRTPSVAPVADTKNAAGGLAYSTGPKHTLAQIACTGTFNGTFHVSAENTLKMLEKAIDQLVDDPEYIAKVAIYAREFGFMKDTPSYIVAKLADLDKRAFRATFRRLIKSGKMLRNVLQIARSGRLSKKYNLSAGTFRHALRDWFADRSPSALFNASIGDEPSFKDIIKMGRPKPNTAEKAALYRYFIGKDYELEALPEPVRSFELFKRGLSKDMPDVDFRFLTSLTLSEANWKQIARNAHWKMTRMNLATFQRHNVFNDPAMVTMIAERLRDPKLVKESMAFPYELYMTYKHVGSTMPFEISEAIQDAADLAVGNVPVFQGKLKVGVDVSGSMTMYPITGDRGTATTEVKCADAAAMFSAAMLRGNKSAELMPFNNRLYPDFKVNPRDSVMTNAQKLRSLPSGGTDCSLVLAELNRRQEHVDAVVYVSDNESWIDTNRDKVGSTGMMREWVELKKRCPKARLVLIDLMVGDNSQVTQHTDILQVGGWSDMVFTVVERFLSQGNEPDFWVKEIEKVSLD